MYADMLDGGADERDARRVAHQRAVLAAHQLPGNLTVRPAAVVTAAAVREEVELFLDALGHIRPRLDPNRGYVVAIRDCETFFYADRRADEIAGWLVRFPPVLTANGDAVWLLPWWALDIVERNGWLERYEAHLINATPRPGGAAYVGTLPLNSDPGVVCEIATTAFALWQASNRAGSFAELSDAFTVATAICAPR